MSSHVCMTEARPGLWARRPWSVRYPVTRAPGLPAKARGRLDDKGLPDDGPALRTPVVPAPSAGIPQPPEDPRRTSDSTRRASGRLCEETAPLAPTARVGPAGDTGLLGATGACARRTA